MKPNTVKHGDVGFKDSVVDMYLTAEQKTLPSDLQRTIIEAKMKKMQK